MCVVCMRVHVCVTLCVRVCLQTWEFLQYSSHTQDQQDRPVGPEGQNLRSTGTKPLDWKLEHPGTAQRASQTGLLFTQMTRHPRLDHFSDAPHIVSRLT